MGAEVSRGHSAVGTGSVQSGTSPDRGRSSRGCCAGIIVLLPDLLLSGTTVSSSFKCMRASVIQERFGSSSSQVAVQGTLLHELFQVSRVSVGFRDHQPGSQRQAASC